MTKQSLCAKQEKQVENFCLLFLLRLIIQPVYPDRHLYRETGIG